MRVTPHPNKRTLLIGDIINNRDTDEARIQRAETNFLSRGPYLDVSTISRLLRYCSRISMFSEHFALSCKIWFLRLMYSIPGGEGE